VTGENEAENTTYINGSVNESGEGSVEFNNDVDLYQDLLAYNSKAYKCYYSSTYKGGIYASSGGLYIDSVGEIAFGNTLGGAILGGTIRPESNGGAYCGTGTYRWYTVCTQGFSASDGSAIEVGSSGSKFRLHITNYSDDGGGWYSYDAYID